MSGIRGKDTKPELLIRSALHRAGFRYRLHAKELPGKPDMVFPKYNSVLFVHGCFWHGHGPDCNLFRWPQSREGFWREKIHRNVERDDAQIRSLLEAGYRVGIIWECALKGRQRLPLDVDWALLGLAESERFETGHPWTSNAVICLITSRASRLSG